jgi:hypothetical protein
MKLLLAAALDRSTVRTITDALFRIDLGARINFDTGLRTVRIEGRLTLLQARAAIEHIGVPVAAVLDANVVDAIPASVRNNGRRHAQAA